MSEIAKNSFNTISARDFLEKKMDPTFGGACLDVRSEGEFAEGALPGFANLPILRNSERHQVGLTYKTQGHDEAVHLGHELVDPVRLERVAAWTGEIDRSRDRLGYVACWRGGLRSRITSTWIHDSGRDVVQIRGGYKAIRHELIHPFLDEAEARSAFSGLRVISGLTGSGKTKLFQALNEEGVAWIDLEKHAQHRGSSFGRRIGDSVPAQASFENLIGWDLFRLRLSATPEFWVEDESRCVGAVSIPAIMKEAMGRAPVAFLEVSMEKRVLNIFDEYVAQPLKSGVTPETLLESLEKSTLALKKRLGGAMTAEVIDDLHGAFRNPDRLSSVDPHASWIEKLLVHYYDKAYQYAFERQSRPVLFRGDENACRQWIFASRKQ